MAMENERRAQIGLRYGPKDMDQYRKVVALARHQKLSNSETGKRLINRGFEHLDNPEPLVKEKVVYRDKEVPVEKVVYRDRPKANQSKHLDPPEGIQEHIGESHHNTGQRASATKLTTRDRADSPSSPDTALGEEKVAKENSGLGWIGLGILAIAGITWWFTRRLT